MTRYFVKRPIPVAATQWFKNGDHPEDAATEMFDYPEGQRPQVVREGAIVKLYHRHVICEQCKQPPIAHGWIETNEGGQRVCPGDWIITGVAGERYPCKPKIFAASYVEKLAEEPSTVDEQYRAMHAALELLK